MKTSEKIDEVIKALFEAQKEIPHVQKTALNPFHKSKYADLNSIMDTITSILHKHNLMVMQFPSYHENKVVVETVIFHVPSAQWLGCEAATPATESAQGTGSAITYLRRYGLVAMAFIATEDDDGEAGTRVAPAAAPKQTSVQAPSVNRSLTEFYALLVSKKITEETKKKWLDWAGVESFDSLSQDKINKLVERMWGMK